MLQIIWEFCVAAERREDFERLYGTAGEWAQLFRRSTDFRGTVLLRDPANAGRYLTIDTWTDAEAFDRFKELFGAEYEALDRECETMTEYELKIGQFESL